MTSAWFKNIEKISCIIIYYAAGMECMVRNEIGSGRRARVQVAWAGCTGVLIRFITTSCQAGAPDDIIQSFPTLIFHE